jgi:hypothetical protein
MFFDMIFNVFGCLFLLHNTFRKFRYAIFVFGMGCVIGHDSGA